MQSLFLTAIGDSRERGARALEAFAYRYPEKETNFERFHVHKTIFPADFLADFGFVSVRAKGRVELARLELGGLQPVEEGTREKVLARRAGGVHARTRAAAALVDLRREDAGPAERRSYSVRVVYDPRSRERRRARYSPLRSPAAQRTAYGGRP